MKNPAPKFSDDEVAAWLNAEVFSFSKLRPATRMFILGGTEGDRNIALFCATLDMKRRNADRDTILDTLKGVTGHLDNEDLATIESAIDHVR